MHENVLGPSPSPRNFSEEMVLAMRGTEDSTDAEPVSSFFEGSEIAEDGAGGVTEELLEVMARDLAQKLLRMSLILELRDLSEAGLLTQARLLAVVRRYRVSGGWR